MRHLLLPILLLGTALHAQTLTDDYIELTVSDTLPLQVKNIVYEIAPADEANVEVAYDENTDYTKVQQEALEQAKKRRKDLEKDLKAQGYVLSEAVPAYSDPYTINSYEADMGTTAPVRVSVKNEAELKELVAWLRARGRVDAHIVEWNYDTTNDPGALLITSLFGQAKKRAEQLAQLGGRKLGKLLLAQDPQQKEVTFQDFIRMLDEREHANSEMERMMRSRLRSMTFRFALTD